MKKRYIKDYVPTESGEYRYRGKYYCSQMTEGERKKEGMIQTVYGISCVVLLLMTLCIPCVGNQTIYVVIPLELTFLCLWPYITGSLFLRKVGERMEQKDYDKAYQNPIQALTISILFYVFSLGGQIIGVLFGGLKTGNGDIYFVMILFFVVVMSCVIWNRQRKLMRYVAEEKMPNSNGYRGDGV